MEKSKIILASGSPRRKELLLQIGIVPEIIVSHVEEKITSDVPAEVVMSLAEQKAVDVAKEMPEGTVILGSDTVVAADGKILGKPKSHEEAYEMIRRLAGRSHQVYTGVCLVKKGPEGEADTVVSFYDETDVNVSPMTEKDPGVCGFRGADGQGGIVCGPGIFCKIYRRIKGILRECDGTSGASCISGIEKTWCFINVQTG